MLKSANRNEILVVEDSAPMRALYTKILSQNGFYVHDCADLASARSVLEGHNPGLVLLDRQLPDGDGFDLLTEIQGSAANIATVVMTAHGTVETAVEAVKLGAADFLEKPFRGERLLVTIRNALRTNELAEEVDTIRSEIKRDGFQGIIGSSLPMQVVYRVIESAATSRASVLITGPSGTGKELCAEAIHRCSQRSSGPFIPVNCAAIPKELFESEIFGHVKGAFSGAVSDRVGAAEAADGGTLFLDELCEMDLDLQAKLLRFLQTGRVQRVGTSEPRPVDVRIVCATNRLPAEEVAAGRFREDLFYRLNVVPVEVPPLSARENDVIAIAERFLLDFSEDEGRQFQKLDDAVRARFLAYDWPGNVRQLENVIRNIVVLNDGETVTLDMLPTQVRDPQVSGASAAPSFASIAAVKPSPVVAAANTGGIRPLWQVEKDAIEQAIEQCSGNVPRAAAFLEVSASTLYRKIKSWESAAPAALATHKGARL